MCNVCSGFIFLLDVVDRLHEFSISWVRFIETLVWKSWHWCLTISWMTCDDFLAWCCWSVARICYAGSFYSNLGVKELALVSYYLLNDLWCLVMHDIIVYLFELNCYWLLRFKSSPFYGWKMVISSALHQIGDLFKVLDHSWDYHSPFLHDFYTFTWLV